MARALVIATMPYKDPKTDAFTRINGDFKLRIVAGYEGGIPFGIYPRFLMSWIATEAVRTKCREIELGESLSAFLRDFLDLSTTGGWKGSGTRVSEQMKRLFMSLITASFKGNENGRAFGIEGVMIADRMRLDNVDRERFDDETGNSLWIPQSGVEAGAWRSSVTLSQNFFNECINAPVPIDLRAYKALRTSPLAMDIYTWLTYRFSYAKTRTRPIPWEGLMSQFGSGYGSADSEDASQAVRNFKKNFLKALDMVGVVYPEAKIAVEGNGLVLYPSSTSIRSLPSRSKPVQETLSLVIASAPF